MAAVPHPAPVPEEPERTAATEALRGASSSVPQGAVTGLPRNATGVVVHPAVPADPAGPARVDVWRGTYPDLLPPPPLDVRDEPSRASMWRDAPAAPVAEHRVLHLLREVHGTGLASRFTELLLGEFPAGLGVLDGTARARALHARCGLRPEARCAPSGPGRHGSCGRSVADRAQADRTGTPAASAQAPASGSASAGACAAVCSAWRRTSWSRTWSAWKVSASRRAWAT